MHKSKFLNKNKQKKKKNNFSKSHIVEAIFFYKKINLKKVKTHKNLSASSILYHYFLRLALKKTFIEIYAKQKECQVVINII